MQRYQQLRIRLSKVSDTGLFCVALTIAYYVRSKFPLSLFTSVESFSTYWSLYLIVAILSPIVLATQGFYNRPLLSARITTVFTLLKGCTLLVISIILAMFLLKLQFARAVVILFGFIGFVLILIKEELLRKNYRNKFTREQFSRRIVLVGNREGMESICAQIKDMSYGLVEVIDIFDLESKPLSELIDCLHLHSINTVVFRVPVHQLSLAQKAICICEKEGVEALLIADFFELQISTVTFDHFCGNPVLVYNSVPASDWRFVTKRIVDVIGSGVLLLLTMPLFLIVTAIIRLSSPGPAFFRQERAGTNGRPFIMYKFRSMTADAEERKKELYVRNEMSGPVFKVTNDPRVTLIGRFLRRYSIDEFPQLINVLRGEMSLVGPRPLPLDEVLRFDNSSYRRRLSVKPGLTCLWQIKGRNSITDFREWVRLDLQYIDNWSLWLDFKILCLTPQVVLWGHGAK